MKLVMEAPSIFGDWRQDYFRAISSQISEWMYVSYSSTYCDSDHSSVGQTFDVRTVAPYRWEFVSIRTEQVEFCLFSIAWSQ